MKPYYEQDGVALYHADCREVLPELSADLVVTDPPFGTQGLGGGYGRRQLHSVNGRDGRTIANDADLSVFREAWPAIVATLSNAYALVFYAARRTPEFCGIVGDTWAGEIVWDKQQPGLGYTVRYQHESIAVLKIGEPGTPEDAIISVQRFGRTDVVSHPHEKPVGLIKSLLRLQPNGVVLDPFSGVGTTLVAAKLEGRKAIGIEIEERYCEISAKRLAQGVLAFP